MSDATLVQININPTFLFYSHRARFAESTPSRTHAAYARSEKAVSNAGMVEVLTSLDILLKELALGYEVIKPIPVKVEKVENGFVASFVAANVNASGDTWDEAALNLRSLIPHLFDLLLTHNREALGPAPRRQLEVLRLFVKKTEDAN